MLAAIVVHIIFRGMTAETDAQRITRLFISNPHNPENSTAGFFFAEHDEPPEIAMPRQRFASPR